MANRKRLFPYRGKEYTMTEIYELFPNIRPSLLNARLNKGMTVEEAISPQTYEEWIPEQYRDKDLLVCFEESVPVFQKMQPEIGRPYTAYAHKGSRH